jgi:hypothetical protein
MALGGGEYVEKEVFVILSLNYFKRTDYLQFSFLSIWGKEGVCVRGGGGYPPLAFDS